MTYEELKAQIENATWSEDNQIEQNDLILEWKKTMLIYEKWARRAAEAQRIVSQLEMKLKVAQAEVSMDVRNNPDDYGWVPKQRATEPTEAFVSSCVLLAPECQAVKEEMFAAQQDLANVTAARDSVMWLRREAISDMIKVLLSGQSMSGNAELAKIRDRVMREIQLSEMSNDTKTILQGD